MNRHYTALTVNGTTPPQENVSARPVKAAIFGIVVAFAALLWIVSVAPTLASFALTAAVAISWCVWLDSNVVTPGTDRAARRR